MLRAEEKGKGKGKNTEKTRKNVTRGTSRNALRMWAPKFAVVFWPDSL